MINRIAVFGSAVGLFLGVLSTGPTTAGAATTLFNTSAASVTCLTVIGTATVNPPISSASSGTAIIKVKATLGGCTSTGATVGGNPQEPTIVSGTVAATLNTAGSAGCAGLLSPSTITGNFVTKWKLASGQKLDFASTTTSGGTITGGLFGGAPLTGAYGQFTLSGQTIQANSAFAGATPSTIAVTGEDALNLGTVCAASPPGKGIKTIHLALGQLTL